MIDVAPIELEHECEARFRSYAQPRAAPKGSLWRTCNLDTSAPEHKDARGKPYMWLTALNIITLVLMLAVLVYVAFAARRARCKPRRDCSMSKATGCAGWSVISTACARRCDSISTGVMTIDIRQRMKK